MLHANPPIQNQLKRRCGKFDSIRRYLVFFKECRTPFLKNVHERPVGRSLSRNGKLAYQTRRPVNK